MDEEVVEEFRINWLKSEIQPYFIDFVRQKEDDVEDEFLSDLDDLSILDQIVLATYAVDTINCGD